MTTPNPTPTGELTPYGELAAILDALPLLLREQRRARRLSMAAAAQQIGTNSATVYRIEAEQGQASLPNAIAVLRWMDCTYTPVEESHG